MVVTRDGRLDRGRGSHTRFYRNDRICPFQQLPSWFCLSENLTCRRFKKCIVLIFLLLFLILLKKRRGAELFKIKSREKEGGGGRRTMGAVFHKISYNYDQTIYDIPSGYKVATLLNVKQKDGRPMLFGFFIIFTPRLTGFCFLSSEDVEKI